MHDTQDERASHSLLQEPAIRSFQDIDTLMNYPYLGVDESLRMVLTRGQDILKGLLQTGRRERFLSIIPPGVLLFTLYVLRFTFHG